MKRLYYKILYWHYKRASDKHRLKSVKHAQKCKEYYGQAYVLKKTQKL